MKRKGVKLLCLMSIITILGLNFALAQFSWDISSGNVYGWTIHRGGGFSVGYNQAGSGSELVWGPLAAYLPDGATYPAVYDTSATPTSGTYTVSVTGQLTSTNPDCVVAAVLHNTGDNADYLWVEIRGWDAGGVALPGNTATVGLLAVQPMSTWNYVIIQTASFTDFAYDADLKIDATVDVTAQTVTVSVERIGGSGAQTLWSSFDVSAYTSLGTSGKTGVYVSVPGFGTPQWCGYKAASGPGTQFAFPGVGYYTDDFEDDNIDGWSTTGGTWAAQTDYPTAGNTVMDANNGLDQFAWYDGASTPASGTYECGAIIYPKASSGLVGGLLGYCLNSAGDRVDVVYLAGAGSHIESAMGGVLQGNSGGFGGIPVLVPDVPHTFYIKADLTANTVDARVDGFVMGPWNPTGVDLSNGGGGGAYIGLHNVSTVAYDDITLPGALPVSDWTLY